MATEPVFPPYRRHATLAELIARARAARTESSHVRDEAKALRRRSALLRELDGPPAEIERR